MRCKMCCNHNPPHFSSFAIFFQYLTLGKNEFSNQIAINCFNFSTKNNIKTNDVIIFYPLYVMSNGTRKRTIRAQKHHKTQKSSIRNHVCPIHLKSCRSARFKSIYGGAAQGHIRNFSSPFY